LDKHFTRPDGLLFALLDDDGVPIDEQTYLYDQAFLLLALALAHRSLGAPRLAERAKAALELLMAERGHKGGLMENGPDPYQANPLMQMLEATLAWEAIDNDPCWVNLSDSIANIARSCVLDQGLGFIGEQRNESWGSPLDRRKELIEPGHQLEWSGLLAQYAKARSDPALIETAWE